MSTKLLTCVIRLRVIMGNFADIFSDLDFYIYNFRVCDDRFN
jgi:hypothetical protein